MITLTEILKGRTINCKTQEEARELLKMAHEKGWKWATDESLIGKTRWLKYGEKTCYYFHTEDKIVYYNTFDKWSCAIPFYELKRLLIMNDLYDVNMETKEFKIQVPEGYEIDKENSTSECIKFKPIKKVITYQEVVEMLFFMKDSYYIDDQGKIRKIEKTNEVAYKDPNNCTSKKQAEKLIAINKLMNVSKYLNGDWHPDWDKPQEKKYYIKVDAYPYSLKVDFNLCYRDGNIYFKSEELAKQAIEILGEDTIKLALSTDWQK